MVANYANITYKINIETMSGFLWCVGYHSVYYKNKQRREQSNPPKRVAFVPSHSITHTLKSFLGCFVARISFCFATDTCV